MEPYWAIFGDGVRPEKFFCLLTFRFFAFSGHFEAFGDLSGYFWGWGGAPEVFLDLLIRTDNFYFVRFFFLTFSFFAFLGSFWAFLGPIGLF